MSTLLEQASLVLIPSGYKEDTVYSVVPSDGSGDLSFTRASNGTRINSAGLVEVCPWNLCTYSEELNIWTTERASVTTNATTAPNGTTTADKVITDSTANNTHQIFIGPFTTQNLPMVISCYAKKSEYNYIHLGGSGASTKTWFNLNDGTVGTQSSDVLSASIENVGNGWYRCINVINNTSTSNYVEFGPASVDGSRVISGTPSGGIFAWGAQLNIGSTAKPYFPTTDRLNVPRLTYQNGGGGCPSLLLEKQSTNLALYSEQFDNAAWIGDRKTITANNTTSPDGTQNADLMTGTAATGSHNINPTTLVDLGNTAGTFSVYAKYNGYNLSLSIAGTSLNWTGCVFDLQNGLAKTPQNAGVQSVCTAKIESVGNGWYRCSISYTPYASGTFYTFIGLTSTNNATLGAYGLQDFTADGTSGLYLWGAQIERSSYGTSYIPTTSASATRVADACFKTGISSLIGQTEGVLFVDFDLITNDGNQVAIITSSAGNEVNRLQIYIDSSRRVGVYRGDASVNILSSAYTLNSRIKAAVKYKLNDYEFYINGVLIGTDTSASIPPTPSVLYLGTYVDQVISNQMEINQCVIFPTALTSTELIALTTI